MHLPEILVFFELLCKRLPSGSSRHRAQIILHFSLQTFLPVCTANQAETYRRQRWRWWAGLTGRGAGRPRVPPTPTGHGGPCERNRWPGPAGPVAPSASPCTPSPGVPPTASSAKSALFSTVLTLLGRGSTSQLSWDHFREKIQSRSTEEAQT